MSNMEKYNKVFLEVFNEDIQNLNSEFSADSIEKWDSVNQMALVEAIEDAFEIMLDIEDIVEFVSYEKGKDILKKYDIEV